MKKVFLGNVITVNDSNMYEEAIVVNDGIIEYVGSKNKALSLAGNDCEIIDYKDNYIYPGFIESHAHGFFAGYRSIGQADLSSIFTGVKDYIPIIEKFILDNPNKEVYIAQGWNETGDILDHSFLDDICSDKILLMNTSGGHSILLNTKAMEYFNIDRDAVKKYGSNLIHTYDSGEPTGYVCESVAVDILNSIKVDFNDAKKYILNWQDTAFSKGYTAVCDAGTELIYKEANEAYNDLTKEGKLKLRTYAYSIVEDNCKNPKDAIKNIASLKNKYDSEYFQIIGGKVFLDGVAEARTSWMIDPYKDDNGYYGVKRFNDKNIMIELLTEASNSNMSIHAHSEGDGATKFFLECIKESQKETKNLDQRNVIAHLHFVKDEDFDNMIETNTIPLVAPLWTPKFPGAYEQELKSFGNERTDNAYPIKSFFEKGCKVCYHTDYPISPVLNVTRSFFMAEKRSIPEEIEFNFCDTARNIKEKVKRIDSLKALTINCAYELKAENKMGSIESGKIANFAIMDKNLLTCTTDDLLKAKLLYTIVDGEVVYSNIE